MCVCIQTMISVFLPKLRYCHIKKWVDWKGFGFNLQYERDKTSPFISKVVSNSPADLSGLTVGDRILEVNGVNIGNEYIQQVQMRINNNPKGTSLLVLGVDADKFYKDRNILAQINKSNVMVITGPETSGGRATVVDNDESDLIPFTGG